MTTTLILALLDLSQDFIIETSASKIGLKVVLIQNTHQISYLSKVLLQNTKVYPNTRRRCRQSPWLNENRDDMNDKHFKTKTDHLS